MEQMIMSNKNAKWYNLSISQRFWSSVVLCVPILMMNFIDDFSNPEKNISINKIDYIEMIFSTLVVWVCGSMFFSKAWSGLKKRQLNMFTLVSLAVFTSWFYSLFALLTPEYFPHEFQISNGVVPVYFDAAAYVTFLVLWGHYIEMRARMEINTDLLQLTKGKISDFEMKQLALTLSKNTEMEMPMQKMIDKIAGYFVFAVLIVALGTFIFWRIYGPQPSGAFALITAVSVLLAACPCALSLATPLSVMLAVNKAATNNVMIKNAGIFEEIHNTRDIEKLEKSGQVVLMNKEGLKNLNTAWAILLPPYIQAYNFVIFSGKVMRNIKENLTLGILYNTIMIPLAAGIFYPYWGIMVGPVIASGAMTLSSAVVIINAFRLKKEL